LRRDCPSKYKKFRAQARPGTMEEAADLVNARRTGMDATKEGVFVLQMSLTSIFVMMNSLRLRQIQI
jgi:hypothetical protein